MKRFSNLVGLLVVFGLFAIGCESMVGIDDTDLALNQGQGQGQGQSVGTVGTSAGSLGKVTLDTEVGWEASTADDGKFVTAEGQGIVIGLRAMERFVGLLDVTGTNGNRVGVYEAATGASPVDPGENNGTWNYDWHVDLSDARGNARGKTIEDYTLVLEQDYTEQSLFGLLGSDPVVLVGTDPVSGTFFAGCADAVLTPTLCQQSWNPGFGNSASREAAGEGAAYDPDDERTYNLRLVLTPETFNGPPLAVVIQVNVSDD